ncbi:hypothetical protein DPMN_130000 [Dreissena polymorpha]|uniref:Uncharacterized protein n=1 Tax=Dreissena polymorpha TaxID=45954 RepID=A0A9D4JXZ1_DREPO|nr:hypothetical protein DPMN_130000 [Dreissena polymorpha]
MRCLFNCDFIDERALSDSLGEPVSGDEFMIHSHGKLFNKLLKNVMVYEEAVWAKTRLKADYLRRALRKEGLMHVRKVSSKISLCRPYMPIRDDTIRSHVFCFVLLKSPLNENSFFTESDVTDKPMRTVQ